MALAGNHGRIIPRDKALLSRLYWDEQHSLQSLGRMFGVTHKSIERVFRELGISRRKRHTKGQSRWRKCRRCNRPVHKLKHAGNGSTYGTLCKAHWNEHRAGLARKEREQPEVREKCKQRLKRWYEQGPVSPKGEGQWIRKSKHLLRSARRLLQTQTPEASASPSAASARAPTSRE